MLAQVDVPGVGQGVQQVEFEGFGTVVMAHAPDLHLRQRLAQFHRPARVIVQRHARVVDERHGRGHDIQAERAACVGRLLDAACHRGVARVQPHALLDARQRHRLGQRPRARAGGALEGVNVDHAAVVVQTQLPQQRGVHRVVRCRGHLLLPQGRDGRQGVTPGLARAAEVRHSPGVAEAGVCRHGPAKACCGLTQQVSPERAAHGLEVLHHGVDFRRPPLRGFMAQPGGQHQAVGVGAVRRAAPARMVSEGPGVNGFVAQPCCRGMGPQPPVRRRRLARAAFGHRQLARRRPGLR